MTTFSQLKSEAYPPGRTLTLDPWVFADEWSGKPREPVCVGLRLMPEAEKSKARSEAERLADELHQRRNDNWLDAFNDALVRQVVALGICDPNDVHKPSSLMEFAEEQVRIALTTLGARYIFDAIELYELEVSQIEPEADDDDLLALSMALQERAAEDFTSVERKMIRRLLDSVNPDPVDDSG